jgi:phage recombination protein Bet
MNPFVGECYLIPFGTGENRKHQIVVGIGFFVKRADKHPLYRGMNSGVMVQNGKEIIRRDGEFLFPGDTLVGGWCQVFVEARQPYVHTVTLSRWKKTTPGPWQNIPEHMIIKVAESQALRRAVPGTGPDAEYDLPIVVEAEADGPLPAFPETTAANVVVGTVADGPEVPAVEVPPEAFMGYCPDHGAAFNQKHGTTKAGKPYNFYSCSVKGPDGWCKKTPEDWLTGELEKVAPGLIEKGKIRERISEYLGVPWAELAPLGYVCIVQQIHEYKESLAQTTAAEPVAEAQPEPEAVVEF